jgi:hypothetical protein
MASSSPQELGTPEPGIIAKKMKIGRSRPFPSLVVFDGMGEERGRVSFLKKIYLYVRKALPLIP